MVKLELPLKIAEQLKDLVQNPIEGFHPNSEPSFVREMREVVFKELSKSIDVHLEDEIGELEDQFLFTYQEKQQASPDLVEYHYVELNKVYSALTGNATIDSATVSISDKMLTLVYANGRERTIELE